MQPLRVIICGLLLLLTLGGCAIVDKKRLSNDDVDEKPWNEPSNWERTVPGV